MSELRLNLRDSIGECAGAQVASGRFSSISDYLGALVTADAQAQRLVEQLGDDLRLSALLEEGLNGGAGRTWSGEVLQELKQQILNRAAKSQA